MVKVFKKYGAQYADVFLLGRRTSLNGGAVDGVKRSPMKTERSIRARHRAGEEAYKRGDYAMALKEFRPLAQEGDADAQFNLGLMYSEGYGVSQDYKEAAQWFRLAAKQGHPDAQLNLGILYAEGAGVPQNYVLAHKWFNLAAVEGDKKSEKARNRVEELMTPAQLAEAQRLAREWMPKSNK